ncbi:MAG: hypothetical protein HDR08_15765 [Lachnospiraceae bacterium]|nr:hypothetical protein [Lachnospiraceae bacterium]
MVLNTNTLYTAIGRFERKHNSRGHSCPVIVLGGKEYMVDTQEMVVWSILNWRIVRKQEIGVLYEEMTSKSGAPVSRFWEACVERLLVRGLVVSGSGETEYDALYDLVSSLYIIPTDASFPLRLAAFLKLVLVNHVPFSAAGRLFRKDRRTSGEKEVIHLARQALLSTAEIIKCLERDIHCLPDENSIMDRLYDDCETTSDNISSLMKSSPCTKDITLAVANLYLRQQIIFERI